MFFASLRMLLYQQTQLINELSRNLKHCLLSIAGSMVFEVPRKFLACLSFLPLAQEINITRHRFGSLSQEQSAHPFSLHFAETAIRKAEEEKGRRKDFLLIHWHP